MGMRGPKAKSGPLDGVFTREDFTPSGILSEVAQAEYDRLVDVLESSGRLPATDPKLIENYAICWDIIQNAYTQIKAEGLTVETDRGNVHKHPSLEALNSAQTRMGVIIRSLRLTPDSERSNISGPSRKGDGEANASGDSWGGILKFGGE